MVAKFFLIAFSCFLILQVDYVRCGDDKNGEMAEKEDFSHPVAKEALDSILRHLRITLTHPVSSLMVRYIATTFGNVMTSAVGQKNVENLIDFLVAFFKNQNSFTLIETIRKGLVRLDAAGPSAPMVLDSASVATRTLVDNPKILAAAEGLVDGFNYMLQDMTPKKLQVGLNRLKRLQSLSKVAKPFLKNPIPKLKKSKSSNDLYAPTDSDSDNEADADEELQARDLSWINGKPQLPVMEVTEEQSIGIDI